MADVAIRVLLIEDDPDDYVLTRALLGQVPGQSFELDWEETYAGGLEALARGEHDVCLVDYHLGGQTGLDLLHAATEGGRTAPLIMLTGLAGPETDTDALRAGAHDFLVKSSIDGPMLDRSIRYAIERHRLEQRLIETQRLESLSVLAAGIAHNFNNLLMGIIGNADVALSTLPADAPVREWIEPIQLAGRRAAELARDMLAYSGAGRFVIEPCDLGAAAEETGRLAAAGARAPVEIHYQFQAGLPLIEADQAQIRQVLISVITNAAEALEPDGGTIEVRGDTVELPDRRLEYAGDLPAGRFVRLEVEDNGVGMDGESLSRLFDPFFTTKFIGRGLGLAAVAGIVRVHRGAIHVASELGVGTVLTLLFPCPGRAHLTLLPDNSA